MKEFSPGIMTVRIRRVFALLLALLVGVSALIAVTVRAAVCSC